MGLVYLKNEEKRIYEAYGMIVYGIQDRYTWSIYPDMVVICMFMVVLCAVIHWIC